MERERTRIARMGWHYTGQQRPHFAETPGLGQESVWDYPRPPRWEEDHREIRIVAGTNIVARSKRAVRVLETASAPTFYLPPQDVRCELLEKGRGRSLCEWKGQASYFDLVLDRRIERAAWCYLHPFDGFEQIAGYLAFYPNKLQCYVNGERATAQAGGFYGGWITSNVVGPMKGEPGSSGW